MKTVAISIIALIGFTLLFSCKNEVKNSDEDLTVISDSISSETTPTFMYVTAVSGLSLREHPNLQSPKLTVMPLGTKVEIINAEGQTTMNVGGIDGAMDEVEYNNQKGFAFNGFMSKFPPAGENAAAKNYAEELRNDFPRVEYSETKGDSVSKPSKIQTLLLPTDKWHEAFFIAQQLFEIPRQFAFPNPKGSNNEVQQNSDKKKGVITSELQISRNGNHLQKIVYDYKTQGYGYKVSIGKNGESMKIEKVEIIQ